MRNVRGFPQSLSVATCRAAIALLFLLALCELAGRAVGLHTPVLYERTSYGYRMSPNQDIRRFGKRVFVNSSGLRSEPVTGVPIEGVIRVLCIGDSITNGGATTDQAKTYPYQLQDLLRSAGRQVEVLNASASRWAIANEAGWLRENGVLGSGFLIVTIGTLDLFQERAGEETVDGHPSFPSHRPTFALENILTHYVLPRLHQLALTDPGAEWSLLSQDLPARNIALLLEMAALAARSGSVPTILLVEQPGRFESSDPQVISAKSLLFQTLTNNKIAWIDSREIVERSGGPTLFRDGVHPNAGGNLVLARMAQALLAQAGNKKPEMMQR
jgi:lysophospholipase L1-like esterase